MHRKRHGARLAKRLKAEGTRFTPPCGCRRLRLSHRWMQLIVGSESFGGNQPQSLPVCASDKIRNPSEALSKTPGHRSTNRQQKYHVLYCYCIPAVTDKRALVFTPPRGTLATFRAGMPARLYACLVDGHARRVGPPPLRAVV